MKSVKQIVIRNKISGHTETVTPEQCRNIMASGANFEVVEKIYHDPKPKKKVPTPEEMKKPESPKNEPFSNKAKKKG
jgi:hypothetical protein